MMNQPKVQVIVPVYNAEKYLQRCLDSLLAQRYTAWEAILINDASTDASAEILAEYQRRDKRFRFIDLAKNSGVSAVRNHALSLLTEKYTAFLDADDYWEDDMLSLLVEKAELHGCDVVQCRFMYDYPGGRQVLPNGAFNRDMLLDKRGMKKVYLRMMTGINMNHVCMKLVRTELLRDLRFDSALRTAEDLLFCVRLFCSVEKYCFVNRPMYHYCRNEESLTGKGLAGREKLRANRIVARHMVKALPEWGMNNVFYKLLCLLRPYLIIASKVIRMLAEKLFSKK